MKLLVAIAPDRYRDEELDEPLAAFRSAGIGFDIGSTRTGICTGMLGGKAPATLTFNQAQADDYAGLVIIGGAGSPASLWGDMDLIRLARAFHNSQKVVAAICLSPVVLARAGILNGIASAVFQTPESVHEMKAGGAVISDKPVVIAGRIITGDGSGAARAFGSAIVAALRR